MISQQIGRIRPDDIRLNVEDQKIECRPWACGIGRCPDGHEILFNHKRKPISQRWPGSTAIPADPMERVTFTSETLFYPKGATRRAAMVCIAATLLSWGASV